MKIFAPIANHPVMRDVDPGDIIFSYKGPEIKSINIALEDVQETYGTRDGYRIDCFYSELEFSLNIDLLRHALANLTPFNSAGNVPNAGYIHHLNAFAAYQILKEIKKIGNVM